MSYILGLSGGYWHDGSACLIKDGQIHAYSEEERFTRKKHNKNSRSCELSIISCLLNAQVSPDEISHIAINWNPEFPAPISTIVNSKLRNEIIGDVYNKASFPSELNIINHHVAHAASSFYCSGFQESAVIVVDGSGDGVATSIYEASISEGLKTIKEYSFCQSLGWFYEFAAEYIGLGSLGAAGKFMGLAAYGDAAYDLDHLLETFEKEYRFNYYLPCKESDYASLGYYKSLKKYLFNEFRKLSVEPADISFEYSSYYAGKIPTTSFTKQQMDFAASVQKKLETAILSLVRYAISVTNQNAVCLSGGVALNCAANGIIREQFPKIKLYICPYANDTGGSVGAAMELSSKLDTKFSPKKLLDSGIGGLYTNDDIKIAILRSGLRYKQVENIAKIVAKLLADGKIIGWFQGRSEAGPRALGHRSILADPRSEIIRDKVNQKVKNRELWRPLCPSISINDLDLFSESAIQDPFMIVAQRATQFAKTVIPGVVHVDGTLRVQCVTKSENAVYYNLLEEMKKLTGYAVVMNTSFNGRGEPIVETPVDAIKAFVSSDIDVLAMDNYIVYKSDDIY